MKNRRLLKRYLVGRKFLITHPSLAEFLSHGCVHIIGAAIVLFSIFFFLEKSKGYEPEFRQIDIMLEQKGEILEYLEMRFGIHPNYKDVYGDQEAISVSGGDHQNGSDLPKPRIIKFESSNPGLMLPKGSKSGDIAIFQDGKLHIDSLSKNHITFSDSDISGKFTTAEVCGDILFGHKKNPYYYIHVNVNVVRENLAEKLNVSGETSITLGGIDHTGKARNPVIITNISPSNYKYDPKWGFTFKTQDVIDNGGIYLIAEDINKKNAMERKTFLYTILVGAALALFIDIIINLVVKWKTLSEKYRHKKNIRNK